MKADETAVVRFENLENGVVVRVDWGDEEHGGTISKFFGETEYWELRDWLADKVIEEK